MPHILTIGMKQMYFLYLNKNSISYSTIIFFRKSFSFALPNLIKNGLLDKNAAGTEIKTFHSNN
jgi:sugar phosphate permease